LAGKNDTRTNPTAETGPVRLPVIKGDSWFDSGRRQFILCVEYPLSAEEMVAALYGVVEPQDIATDEDLCGSVAVTLSMEGLRALTARVVKIRRDEQHGAVQSVSFLTECRERVIALLHARGWRGAGR
jgi:hypothetical protein